MDSLTQAALGAAVGEAILGNKIGGKAALIGAIVGTIPDLDVLLTPFFSPLENLSIHRGYSHSMMFCCCVSRIFLYFSDSGLSDGLKITAPIFDSLKFSKQATKRRLRENIRESVEKMGVVISVFSLRSASGLSPESFISLKYKV